MRSAPLVLTLLGLCVLTGCGAAEVKDPATVYCLAGAASDPDVPTLSPNRSALLDAAVALNRGARVGDQLEVDGTRLSIDQWRRSRPEDFAAVCSALFQSTRDGSAPPSGDPPEWLKTILGAAVGAVSAILGAWFTVLFARRKDEQARRREQATELRLLGERFVAQVQRYVHSRLSLAQDGPTDQDVRESRDRLRARLETMAGRVDGLPGVVEAIESLDSGPLGADLVSAWARDRARATHERLAVEIRTAVGELGRRVDDIAEAYPEARRARRTAVAS